MYNRYIPQPDGSYRRSRVPDPQRNDIPTPSAPIIESSPEKADCCIPSDPPAPPERPKPEPRRQIPPCRQPRRGNPQGAPRKPQEHKQESQGEKKDTGVFDFLKNLMPKDFDTGDLMIVLLLLLMSADSSEDQNSALLTLALYLFL